MTSGWAEGRDEDRDAGSEVEFDSESVIDPQMHLDDERLLREVPPHHGV